MVQLPKPHLLIHPSTGSHGLEFIHIINSTSSLSISYAFDTHFLDNFNPPTPKKKISLPLMFIRFHCFTVHFPLPTTSLTAERLASKKNRGMLGFAAPHPRWIRLQWPSRSHVHVNIRRLGGKMCGNRCVFWDCGWDFSPGKKGRFLFRKKKNMVILMKWLRLMLRGLNAWELMMNDCIVFSLLVKSDQYHFIHDIISAGTWRIHGMWFVRPARCCPSVKKGWWQEGKST